MKARGGSRWKARWLQIDLDEVDQFDPIGGHPRASTLVHNSSFVKNGFFCLKNGYFRGLVEARGGSRWKVRWLQIDLDEVDQFQSIGSHPRASTLVHNSGFVKNGFFFA